MSSVTSTTLPTTPPTTPSTTSPTETYLIMVTLCSHHKPIGGRILSVPGETRFKVFHEAITEAVGWDNEQCTLWAFKDTKKIPSATFPLPDDPGLYYSIVIPSRLDDNGQLNEWMSLETQCRFWLHDYRISKQHHVIQVLSVVADDRPSKIYIWGGKGSIKRQAPQPGDFRGQDAVTAIKDYWEKDMASTHTDTGSVQTRYQKLIANEAVVDKGKTGIKEEDHDDVAVRRVGGTKRKLSDSF